MTSPPVERTSIKVSANVHRFLTQLTRDNGTTISWELDRLIFGKWQNPGDCYREAINIFGHEILYRRSGEKDGRVLKGIQVYNHRHGGYDYIIWENGGAQLISACDIKDSAMHAAARGLEGEQ